MKKLIPFLVLSLIITNSVLSQNSVEYDFKTKSLDTIKPVKIGENCVFKVKNINKFIYEVKIKSSQSEFYSEPPEVFSNMLKIEKHETNTVQSAVDGVNEQINRSPVGQEMKNKYLKIQDLEDSLENKKYTKSDPEGLRKNIDSISSKFYFELNQKQEDKGFDNEDINKLIFKRLTIIQSKGKILSKSFYRLEETKDIKNKLIRISLIDGIKYDEVKEKVDDLLKEYSNLLELNSLLKAFEENYDIVKRVSEVYKLEIINKCKGQGIDDNTFASVEALLKEADKLNYKVSAYDYNLLFQEINKLYTELLNENNYFVVSDPIQAKEDIINYNLIIKPREGNDPIFASEERDFNVEVPIYGGVKIDFSTGFFVTNNLYNRKYSISNYLADSSMSIISQDKNNSLAQFSLGALLHVSKRCNKNFKPALTFGLGLNSTDLTNLQAFLGLSAMLGSSERFIISTGLSLANVDYLKGKYSLGNPTLNLNDDTPLTEKVIKAGWFISFTYNLTSKKKEQ